MRVHAIALTRENVREAIALIRSQSPNMMVFNGPAGISVNCKGVPLISWGQYLVCEPDGVFRAMDREAFRNTYVEGWNGRDSK